MSLFITRQEFLKLEIGVLGRLSDLKTVAGGKDWVAWAAKVEVIGIRVK
jgi:hypothetical protein